MLSSGKDVRYSHIAFWAFVSLFSIETGLSGRISPSTMADNDKQAAELWTENICASVVFFFVALNICTQFSCRLSGQKRRQIKLLPTWIRRCTAQNQSSYFYKVDWIKSPSSIFCQKCWRAILGLKKFSVNPTIHYPAIYGWKPHIAILLILFWGGGSFIFSGPMTPR